jgi:hypothetical protein
VCLSLSPLSLGLIACPETEKIGEGAGTGCRSVLASCSNKGHGRHPKRSTFFVVFVLPDLRDG